MKDVVIGLIVFILMPVLIPIAVIVMFIDLLKGIGEYTQWRYAELKREQNEDDKQ